MTPGLPDALPDGLPDALAATHRAANDFDRPWTAAEFAALLGAPGVVLTGDATAFVLGRVTLDEAEVLTLATHPDHRRQGRARSALDAFVAGAARAGATRVLLDVAADNTAARALYVGAGFVQVARRPRYFARAGGAVDAIVMARDALAD